MLVTYDSYALRKISESEKVDQGRVIKAIADVAKQFELHCVRCDSKEMKGLYSNDSLTLRYQIIEQSRGVRFQTSNQPGNPIFGKSSREKLDRLKHAIKRALGRVFANMEYVEYVSEGWQGHYIDY